MLITIYELMIGTYEPSLKQTISHILHLLFQVQLAMMCPGLQSCKLVIWTPTEHLELDISFDKDFTDTHMKHLQNFYFSHKTSVDQFVAKKIQLYPKYIPFNNLLKIQFSR